MRDDKAMTGKNYEVNIGGKEVPGGLSETLFPQLAS
jgi:hypothetical protein